MNLNYISSIRTIPVVLFFLFFVSANLFAGEYPKYLTAYRGTTPVVDGILSPGEWDDAMSFNGTRDWNRDAVAVTDSTDLSMTGWVKHDGVNLYFAFDVRDDVIYGYDIDRWLPDLNVLLQVFD
jgi:hypothetical protein